MVAFGVLYVTTGSEILIPGVDLAHPLNSTGTLDSYEDAFNGTANVDTWEPSGNYGFAGDIYSGLNMFWTTFRFLIDGLGMTLEWVGSFVPVANVAFTVIAWIIRILTAATIATLVFEIITGRQLLE